ncbi:GGDEF domain-containing protein [Desulforamulus ruminis]|uniref:GGDEF domain-containing protein n=1 Tax=Desulforamulus ruminis TaxID=1564 RepID=UPI002FD910C5
MDFFNINMGTMLIVIILGHLLTGVLIIAYTAQHKRTKTVNTFLLSKLLQALAWFMIGLRNPIPNMVLIAVGNSILFIGAALELIAFLILKNSYTKRIKRAYISLLIGCIIVFVSAIAYGFPENVRITLGSSITIILMVFPVYKLFADKKSSILQKIIASFYSVTIPFSIFRAYTALTTDLDMNLASTNIFNTGLFLLLYIAMLAGSTGFILLDKEKLDADLLKAASFDGLTNTLNRKTFILRSKELISLFARKQEQISYLLIDIDDFKKINDTHGHYAGDIVLQDFADTLRKQLRNYDLIGRYGGEEFAVLLPGTGKKEAGDIAERLRAAVEDSSIQTDTEIKYTVSIGVCTIIPDKETSIDMLYKLSDKALYTAKKQGKNCCRNAIKA